MSSEQVWAYNPSCSLWPPTSGWHIPPGGGIWEPDCPVDSEFKVLQEGWPVMVLNPRINKQDHALVRSTPWSRLKRMEICVQYPNGLTYHPRLQQVIPDFPATVTGAAVTEAAVPAGGAEEVLLQNSFSSSDAMFLQKVRHEIDTYLSAPKFLAGPGCKPVPHVRMCQLLDPSVDSGWFQRWLEQMLKANGVIIVKSRTYLSKVKQRQSALWREAQQLLLRMQIDKNFRVYVLDPDKPSQGPHDLRCWLMDGETEMNSSGWQWDLQKLDVTIAPETLSHYLATSLRAGLAMEKPDFDNLAGSLQRVHPADATLLLAKADEFGCQQLSMICEEELKRSFASIEVSDLALVNDHEKIVRIFDADDLCANEDEVWTAITQYLALKRAQLTDIQVTALWSTCRWAFVSYETCLAAEKLPLMPIDWVFAGVSRSRCPEEHLLTFMEEQTTRRGDLARRLKHRLEEESQKIPSPYTVLPENDEDTVQFTGSYVEPMFGFKVEVTQTGCEAEASNEEKGLRAKGSVVGSTIFMFGMSGSLVMKEIRWANGSVWRPSDFLFEVVYDERGTWTSFMKQQFKEKGLESVEDVKVEDSNGKQLGLNMNREGEPQISDRLDESMFPLTFKQHKEVFEQCEQEGDWEDQEDEVFG